MQTTAELSETLDVLIPRLEKVGGILQRHIDDVHALVDGDIPTDSRLQALVMFCVEYVSLVDWCVDLTRELRKEST